MADLVDTPQAAARSKQAKHKVPTPNSRSRTPKAQKVYNYAESSPVNHGSDRSYHSDGPGVVAKRTRKYPSEPAGASASQIPGQINKTGRQNNYQSKPISRSENERNQLENYHLDGAVDSSRAHRHSVSHAVVHHDNTPVRQAYAGPTFHASPAASALPLPRFFSKSVPPDTPPSMHHAEQSTDPASHNLRAGLQHSQTVPREPVLREESPLDFLLDAHRAELAKRKGSFGSQGADVGHREFGRKSLHGTPRAAMANNGHRKSSAVNSPEITNKEAFMMEMDGIVDEDEEDDRRGASEGVSFMDRLNAIKAQSTPGKGDSLDPGEEDRLAKTKALKKLLLTSPELSLQQNATPSAAAPAIPTKRPPSQLAPVPIDQPTEEKLARQDRPLKLDNPRQHNWSEHQQMPHLNNSWTAPFRSHSQDDHSNINPSSTATHITHQTPTESHQDRDYSQAFQSQNTATKAGDHSAAPQYDIKSMEDNLRRMLKLDGPAPNR